MVRIHERFEEEGLKSKMILQVHDELNFNVYKRGSRGGKENRAGGNGKRHETTSPLIADCGEGENWLEAH